MDAQSEEGALSGHETLSPQMDGWVTPDSDLAHLWSLVLQAADIDHDLHHTEAGWQLQIPEKKRSAAMQELRLFAEENHNWPPQRAALSDREGIVEKSPPVLPVIGALVIFHAVTGGWEGNSSWFASGALDRAKVLGDGQWWRLVTALTLHADSAHLLGNIFFGGLLVYSLCRHLGSGIAWFAVLFTAVLANGINVFFQDEFYRSIGFSTAVFGMVGMLSGMRLRRIGGWQEMVLALGSAASLLALMGSSGERTDLGAHFWGVGVGLPVGVILVALGFAGKRVVPPGWQWLLFAGSLAMVLGCWLCALYPFGKLDFSG